MINEGMKKGVRFAACALALAAPGWAGAVVIVGATNLGVGNCVPFGCPNSNIGFGAPLLEYQQVYTNTAFSGPVTITSILFYNTQQQPGVNPITSGTDTLSLSTTSKAVSAFSSTVSSNIGADQTVIFSGTAAGTVPLAGIEFGGGSFLYDPRERQPAAGCGAFRDRRERRDFSGHAADLGQHDLQSRRTHGHGLRHDPLVRFGDRLRYDRTGAGTGDTAPGTAGVCGRRSRCLRTAQAGTPLRLINVSQL